MLSHRATSNYSRTHPLLSQKIPCSIIEVVHLLIGKFRSLELQISVRMESSSHWTLRVELQHSHLLVLMRLTWWAKQAITMSKDLVAWSYNRMSGLDCSVKSIFKIKIKLMSQKRNLRQKKKNHVPKYHRTIIDISMSKETLLWRIWVWLDIQMSSTAQNRRSSQSTTGRWMRISFRSINRLMKKLIRLASPWARLTIDSEFLKVHV